MNEIERIPIPTLEREFIDSITRLVGNQPLTGNYSDQQIAIGDPDLSRDDLLQATGSEEVNFINIGIIGYGAEDRAKDYYINFIEHTDKYVLCTSFMLDENKFGCITEGQFRDHEAYSHKNRKLILVKESDDDQEIEADAVRDTKTDQAHDIYQINEVGITTAPEDPERFKAVLRLLEEIIEKDSLIKS